MNEGTNTRIAYYNGEYLPEGDIRIPFRDSGFLYGDAVFDMTRTFGGRIFKIEEHVLRLYRSLKAVRIDSRLSVEEMIQISEEVLRRNAHFLDEGTDYWVAQRVSRGLSAVGDEGWDQDGPTVIVECIPLPLSKRATYYRDGIDLQVSPIRRTPPDSLTPRAKTHNYLNLIYANQAVSPTAGVNAYTLMLDHNGNLAEGLGANLFLVRDGICYTPREQFVLPGVSRQTILELAEESAIKVVEKDLDFHDAYNAEEIFLTSTSLCIVPVRTFCGAVIGNGIPGPITEKLTQAYVSLVDFDFVSQYLANLPMA